MNAHPTDWMVFGRRAIIAHRLVSKP